MILSGFADAMNTQLRTKTLLLFFLLVPLIGLDRITKNLAVGHLKGADSFAFLEGFLMLTYRENSGGMLSLGSNLPEAIRFAIFIVLAGGLLIAVLGYFLVTPMKALGTTAWMLILAGGFANLYDRVFFDGRVIDFMVLQLGPVRTGVFNVADMAIMSGLLGLLFQSRDWGRSRPH